MAPMKRSLEAKPQQSETKLNTKDEWHAGPIRLLLQTCDGIIPYLTPMLLQKYFPAPQNHLALAVAVRDTCSKPTFPSPESTKPNGYAFSSSTGQTASPYLHITVPSFDLIHDSIGKSPVAAHDTHLMLWTPHGRQSLTPHIYQTLTTTSSASVSLFDIATDHDRKKRKDAAVRRTMQWWHDHNDLANKDPSHMLLFPIVLVGREIHTPQPAKGYALVGLDNIATRIDRNQRLHQAVTLCDPKSMKIVLSCQTVEQLLDVIRLGIDMVGTSLPTVWAQSQRAFACHFTTTTNHKKQRQLSETTAMVLDQHGCFDLGHVDFCRDDRPLVEGCCCLACQHHTRAYIHHLILAKELLAQILLFAHNLTHLLAMFQQANAARQENELQQFCDLVEQQLGKSNGTRAE